MRKIYTLFALAFLMCCLFACQKDGNKGNTYLQPVLIVGKWNLQKENVLITVNGTTQIDTSVMASSYNKGYALFNSNNTFVSVSSSVQPINIGSLNGSTANITTRDSTAGVYSFTNSVFALNATVSGFNYNKGGAFGTTTTTEIPVISNISKSVQITQLTTSSLTLHSESMYTSTTSTSSATYKTEQDFFYSK